MSSVFLDHGNGVNPIFVMNESLSMRALRLDTNTNDYFFPFPHPLPYEADPGVHCRYGLREERLIYTMIASMGKTF